MWQSKGFSPPRLLIPLLIPLLILGTHRVIGSVTTCLVDGNCPEQSYCLDGLCIGICILCDKFNREEPTSLRPCARSLDDCGPCKTGNFTPELPFLCDPDENVYTDSVHSAPYLIYCFVALFLVILLTAAVDLVRKLRLPSVERELKVMDASGDVGSYIFIPMNEEFDHTVEMEEEFPSFTVHDNSFVRLNRTASDSEDDLMEEAAVSIEDFDDYSNASTVAEDDLNWRRNLETFDTESSEYLYSDAATRVNLSQSS